MTRSSIGFPWALLVLAICSGCATTSVQPSATAGDPCTHPSDEYIDELKNAISEANSIEAILKDTGGPLIALRDRDRQLHGCISELVDTYSREQHRRYDAMVEILQELVETNPDSKQSIETIIESTLRRPPEGVQETVTDTGGNDVDRTKIARLIELGAELSAAERALLHDALQFGVFLYHNVQTRELLINRLHPVRPTLSTSDISALETIFGPDEETKSLPIWAVNGELPNQVSGVTIGDIAFVSWPEKSGVITVWRKELRRSTVVHEAAHLLQRRRYTELADTLESINSVPAIAQLEGDVNLRHVSEFLAMATELQMGPRAAIKAAGRFLRSKAVRNGSVHDNDAYSLGSALLLKFHEKHSTSHPSKNVRNFAQQIRTASSAEVLDIVTSYYRSLGGNHAKASRHMYSRIAEDFRHTATVLLSHFATKNDAGNVDG